ncbi:MAG: MFS transporter, partial [Patescibacteria group bacterium]|nr:MFS transporter [Patescibacteria group bacterium]
MFKKNEIKLLFPFYAHSLIFNLSKVIMPFYVLYFLHIGFNFFQIALISSIRSVVTLIFEIPTGVIADKYGRKNSVILGYLLTAISLALIPVWDKFYIVAIIFAFDALFETLVSGADRAWAVDLMENTDKSLVDKYFLKTRMFRNIGMVAAPLIGGYIVATSNMRNLWFVFAAGIFVSTLILFFGKEIRKHEQDKPIAQKKFCNIFQDSKTAIKTALSHKIIILLFSGIFVFFFVDEITSLIWTPHLEKIGLSLPMIGYLFSIIAGLGIILPLVAEFFLKKKSKLFILFFLALGYAILLFAAAKTSLILFTVIL